MTIAPKKPRVEGGGGGEGGRRERTGNAASASTARPPPDLSRSYEDGGSVSGRRGGRVGQSVKGSASSTSVPAKAPKPPHKVPLEEAPERNSDDEHEAAPDVSQEEEEAFLAKLADAGLAVKAMGEDGACLFRAVADQVYGDQEFHGTVRTLCMDYMEKNRDYFSQFVTEDWREYVRRKRAADAHGNHVEIQAMAELFARPIEVYQPGPVTEGRIQPMNTFQTTRTVSGEGNNPPIRVSYHARVHYNSIVEPWGPATVGVGLGLPGLAPVNHHAAALREAAAISEREGIEQAMLQDKLRATDHEATNADLADQVLRQSMIDFIRESEERLRKENAPCHSGSLPNKRSPKPTSSAKAGLSSKPNSPKPPASSSKPASPKAECSSTSAGAEGEGSPVGALDTASILNSLPASALSSGLSGADYAADDEDDVLNRILALSQQEYLDSLKRQIIKLQTSKTEGEKDNEKSSEPSS